MLQVSSLIIFVRSTRNLTNTFSISTIDAGAPQVFGARLFRRTRFRMACGLIVSSGRSKSVCALLTINCEEPRFFSLRSPHCFDSREDLALSSCRTFWFEILSLFVVPLGRPLSAIDDDADAMSVMFDEHIELMFVAHDKVMLVVTFASLLLSIEALMFSTAYLPCLLLIMDKEIFCHQ